MIQPNETLAERYRVIKKVGGGGMGTVYEGWDSRLERQCAIKVLNDNNLVSAEERTAAQLAFEEEAKLLARLSHANLPAIYDYFQIGHHYYIVMEFVEGQTLAAVQESRRQNPLSEKEILVWAEQICNVLRYLHEQNPPIVFRDVNPRNIMLEPDGKVKLIDFGIARIFKPGKEEDTVPMGTPGFAPPEQYGRSQTDARSDIYALGVTLWSLLTDKQPEEQFKDGQSVGEQFNEGVLPEFFSTRNFNREVTVNTDRVIARATQILCERRFQSILEMQNALHGHWPTNKLNSHSPALPKHPEPRYESAQHVRKPTFRKSWLEWSRIKRFGTATLGVVLLGAATVLVISTVHSLLSATLLQPTPTVVNTVTTLPRASRTIVVSSPVPTQSSTATPTRSPTSTPIPAQIKESNIGKLQPLTIKTDVFSFAWLPSQVSEIAVAGSEGISIYQLGNSDGRLVTAEVKEADALSIRPDGELLASHSYSTPIELVSLVNNSITALSEPVKSISDLAFFDQSTMFSLDESGNQVILWSTANLTVSSVYSLSTANSITAIATNARNDLLAFSDDGDSIYLWAIQNPDKPVSTLSADHSARAIVFSPDGQWLAAVGGDPIVKVWNLLQEQSYRLSGHLSEPLCVAFTNDGRLLATGGADYTIRIWDVQNQVQLRVLDKLSARVSRLQFDPSGKFLASMTDDNVLQVWAIRD